MRPWNDHPRGHGLCYPARVEPTQIAYVCAVTEAHEGLAVVRTCDQKAGLIEFWVSPLQQTQFEEYLRALEQEIDMVVGPPGAPDLSDMADLSGSSDSSDRT